MGKMLDFNSIKKDNNVIYNRALYSFLNHNSPMQKKILHHTNKEESGVDFIFNLADASDYLYELETMINNKEFLKNISFYYLALSNYGNLVEKENGLSGSIDRDFFIDIRTDKGSIKYSCRDEESIEKGYLRFFDNKYFINYKKYNHNKMVNLDRNASLYNDSTASKSFFFAYDDSKVAEKDIERNTNYFYKNKEKVFIPSSDETNVIEIKKYNKVNNLVLYNHVLKYLNKDNKLFNIKLVDRDDYYYGYDFNNKFDVSKIYFNEIDYGDYKSLLKRK